MFLLLFTTSLVNEADVRLYKPSEALICVTSVYSPGVFSESVSVMERDSVTLNTGVTEIREDDDILWKYGAENSRIAKMKKKKQIQYNVTDERFRYRLKLNNQTGSLTITNITTEHAGLYKVEISGANLTSKTFSVSVYGE